jgi:ribonuclease BN (tRNA processing enzyme)
MSIVTLIPMGVGEAFTARYYTSCLLVAILDNWLMINRPHRARKMLHQGSIAAGLPKPLDFDDIYAVALSHLHADHCCRPEAFGYYSFFALGLRAKLLMHPDASARIWDGLLATGMELIRAKDGEPASHKKLSDDFELIDLEQSGSLRCGPFTIECHRTIHSIPIYAFRVTADNRVLGYSADTAYDPALIEWLAPADLIIHEVTTMKYSGGAHFYTCEHADAKYLNCDLAML